MLHKRNSRLEDTSNNVLRIFGSANPLGDSGPVDAVPYTPPVTVRRAE
jgi:hypothetical protein